MWGDIEAGKLTFGLFRLHPWRIRLLCRIQVMREISGKRHYQSVEKPRLRP